MAAWQWHAFGWGASGVTQIAVSDTIAVSESLSARVVLGLSDAVPVTETAATVVKAYIVVSDSIAVTESVATTVKNYISLTDNIPVVESPSKLIYQFGGAGPTLFVAMVDELDEGEFG